MQSVFVDDLFIMQETFPVPGYIGRALHVVNLEVMTVQQDIEANAFRQSQKACPAAIFSMSGVSSFVTLFTKSLLGPLSMT